jgi:hypothetical protein
MACRSTWSESGLKALASASRHNALLCRASRSHPSLTTRVSGVPQLSQSMLHQNGAPLRNRHGNHNCQGFSQNPKGDVMRIMAGATLAAISVLAIYPAGPASAAPQARTRNCTGEYQALQNGTCVETQFRNPDRNRVSEFCNGYCYRSSSRHRRHRVANR